MKAMKKEKLFTRNFTLLILGQVSSLTGNYTLKFALSMYVLEQTGSASIFAGMLSAALLPTVLLSPFGGILADRANRKHIMVALDALSGLSVLAVGLLPYVGYQLLSLLLTNVLTREEGAFLTLLGAAAILWSAVLMVLGLKVVHEFSFGRTVLAVLYSLIGILIILFLALLLWSLFQQLAMFLVSLYDELSLKLK